jgi:hypothetical protein
MGQRRGHFGAATKAAHIGDTTDPHGKQLDPEAPDPIVWVLKPNGGIKLHRISRCATPNSGDSIVEWDRHSRKFVLGRRFALMGYRLVLVPPNHPHYDHTACDYGLWASGHWGEEEAAAAKRGLQVAIAYTIDFINGAAQGTNLNPSDYGTAASKLLDERFLPPSVREARIHRSDKVFLRTAATSDWQPPAPEAA